MIFQLKETLHLSWYQLPSSLHEICDSYPQKRISSLESGLKPSQTCLQTVPSQCSSEQLSSYLQYALLTLFLEEKGVQKLHNVQTNTHFPVFTLTEVYNVI